MKPIISIIIPVFNRQFYIGETLNSVLNQSFIDWECLIIDDYSTDKTIKIVNEFVNKDSRFHLLKRPISKRKGASSCRNYGLKNSVGRFVQFLDSDDLLSKRKIELQIKTVLKKPCIDLLTCKWGRFYKNIEDQPLQHNLKAYNNYNSSYSFLQDLADSHSFFPLHAYLFKKEIIKQSGYWNEMLSSNDDADFVMRYLAYCKNIHHVNEVVAYYRYGNKNNLSSYDNISNIKNSIEAWKLIESFLNLRYKNKNVKIISKVKYILFRKAMLCSKDVVNKNQIFFKAELQQYRKENSISSKIKKKLRKIINRY